jgi:uncharacterized OB-fold protein
MSAEAKPLPHLDDANRPFWEGAPQGRLMLQRCAQCGAWRFPAAPCCAHCRSPEARWEAASGRGVVQSFCIFHKAYFPGFAGELPYNVVQVRLEEGAQLFSNLLDVANEDIRIGMAVEACFEDLTPEIGIVKFRPAAGESR